MNAARTIQTQRTNYPTVVTRAVAAAQAPATSVKTVPRQTAIASQPREEQWAHYAWVAVCCFAATFFLLFAAQQGIWGPLIP